jgi:hypothetical protein
MGVQCVISVTASPATEGSETVDAGQSHIFGETPQKVLQNLEIEISILRTYQSEISFASMTFKKQRHFYLILEYWGGTLRLIRTKRKKKDFRKRPDAPHATCHGLKFLWRQN